MSVSLKLQKKAIYLIVSMLLLTFQILYLRSSPTTVSIIPVISANHESVTASNLNKPIGNDSLDCHGRYGYDPKYSMMLVIISCSRWELLFETIESFEYYNTYNCILSKIIIDDCINNNTDKLKNATNMIQSKYGHYGYKLVQTSTPRIPQYSKTDVRTMYSIYEALSTYNEMHANYVFQLEDDWRFYKHGFLV